MELREILDEIKKRWIISEHYENIYFLEKSPMGAATGSEGLILICQYIRNLKNVEKAAYNEINDLAEFLFEYEKRAFKQI